MKLLLLQPQLKAFDDGFNLSVFSRLLDRFAAQLTQSDIVLLPEHARFSSERSEYEEFTSDLARRYGCTIVGGSYHESRGDIKVNAGSVVQPDGAVAARFEKLRPYAEERNHVQSGSLFGECTVGGRNILILVCADFWFSDLFFRATVLPDLVLVPALSVTRKSTPAYSRELWRHLAISRAYEFGVYVGISDWGFPSKLPRLITSGVGGFTDPTGLDPGTFFSPIDGDAQMFDIDFAALDTFRLDRRERGFFWKE